jgi:L-seryl-tRNA(Ser) seleniumtransferase
LQAETHRSPEDEDYYDKLGVAKIINAAGTYTALTASTMPPSVQAAIARAAKHPVRLLELQKAAGEYIARQLRGEGALVTNGAASALTLGTAASCRVGQGLPLRPCLSRDKTACPGCPASTLV